MKLIDWYILKRYLATFFVMLLMFICRVGLLSFFTAMILRRGQPPAYMRPAQEDVIVG